MTREEINELIEYLEKNYHVKCKYRIRKDEFGEVHKLVVLPTLKACFFDHHINKEFIISKLNALDLIRF